MISKRLILIGLLACFSMNAFASSATQSEVDNVTAESNKFIQEKFIPGLNACADRLGDIAGEIQAMYELLKNNLISGLSEAEKSQLNKVLFYEVEEEWEDHSIHKNIIASLENVEWAFAAVRDIVDLFSENWQKFSEVLPPIKQKPIKVNSKDDLFNFFVDLSDRIYQELFYFSEVVSDASFDVSDFAFHLTKNSALGPNTNLYDSEYHHYFDLNNWKDRYSQLRTEILRGLINVAATLRQAMDILEPNMRHVGPRK